MDIDIKELIKTATENLNLKDFKGDVVAVKVVENEFGTIEDGGIGVQNVYYGADGKKTVGNVTAEHADEGESDVLATPEAQRMWEVAQQEGWVDARRMPKVSQPKAAILASVMADELHLSPRWAPFEELWGIDDLATKFSKSQNFSYYADTIKAMRNALK